MFNCDEYNLKRFAYALNKLRKSYGMSQQELADKAGCKQFDITRYENAKIYPQSDEILDGLGKALGMDPYYLKYCMSLLKGGSVRETPYGKEIEMHHFDVNYKPKYVDDAIPSLVSVAYTAADDELYMKTMIKILSEMSQDDRAIMLETAVLLNRLKEENIQKLETNQEKTEECLENNDRVRRKHPNWLMSDILDDPAYRNDDEN